MEEAVDLHRLVRDRVDPPERVDRVRREQRPLGVAEPVDLDRVHVVLDQQVVDDRAPVVADARVTEVEGEALPRLVAAAGCRVWSPFFREVSKEALEEAKRLGLDVVVWTVNDPTDMESLIEMGVDGIITDYPDRLRRVAGARGIPLPEPTPVAP